MLSCARSPSSPTSDSRSSSPTTARAAPTEALVDGWRTSFGERLVHVMATGRGFRLARVLNLGALAVDADYLVVHARGIDPRRHFVRAIRSCIGRDGLSRDAAWSSLAALTGACSRNGSRPSLGHARVARARKPGRAARWLDASRPPPGRSSQRSGVRPARPDVRLPPGVDRADFERVNGYDMRFVGWGEEDVDIASRLRRIGLRCGHAGPDATLIHLWHESEIPAERPNWYLLQATEQSDRIEAIEGLRELAGAGSRMI